MKALPFPLRIAAGIAATAAEQVRRLPEQVVGLPLTVVSQVLQISMRLQQQATELAIKGDEVLSAFRSAEENPSWATFDEDLEPDSAPTPETNAHSRVPEPRSTESGSGVNPSKKPPEEHPTGIAGYGELTLPQLRARLRKLSLAELEDLLAYERNHANRTSFVGMLARRIGNVYKSTQTDELPEDNGSGSANQ